MRARARVFRVFRATVAVRNVASQQRGMLGLAPGGGCRHSRPPVPEGCHKNKKTKIMICLMQAPPVPSHPSRSCARHVHLVYSTSAWNNAFLRLGRLSFGSRSLLEAVFLACPTVRPGMFLDCPTVRPGLFLSCTTVRPGLFIGSSNRRTVGHTRVCASIVRRSGRI